MCYTNGAIHKFIHKNSSYIPTVWSKWHMLYWKYSECSFVEVCQIILKDRKLVKAVQSNDTTTVLVWSEKVLIMNGNFIQNGKDFSTEYGCSAVDTKPSISRSFTCKLAISVPWWTMHISSALIIYSFLFNSPIYWQLPLPNTVVSPITGIIFNCLFNN